jgi:hypothetical protein
MHVGEGLTQEQFGDIEKEKDTKDIVARRNKRSCCNGRVDIVFVKDDGYKSPDKRSDNNNAEHGNGNGHADFCWLVGDHAKQNDK